MVEFISHVFMYQLDPGDIKKNIYVPQGSNWAQCQAPYLRAVAPGLVGGDHHIGGHEEGAILRRGHHVVSLVPDPGNS